MRHMVVLDDSDIKAAIVRRYGVAPANVSIDWERHYIEIDMGKFRFNQELVSTGEELEVS